MAARSAAIHLKDEARVVSTRAARSREGMAGAGSWRKAGTLAALFAAAFALRLGYDLSLAPDRTPLPLRVPLAAFPPDALGPCWAGVDRPLDAETVERAGVSSYLLREYRCRDMFVLLYVGYVGEWSPGAVHYPEVCFPGGGLRSERQETVEVSIPASPGDTAPHDTAPHGAAPPGAALPVRLRESVWQVPEGGRRYTLATFYVNGRFEPDEMRLRAERVLARYFAIVTFSGSMVSGGMAGDLEETRRVYEDLVKRALPRLVAHFPAERAE
jgi:hypothetical protein